MRSLISIIFAVLLSRVFMAFWAVVLIVSAFMLGGYFIRPKKM